MNTNKSVVVVTFLLTASICFAQGARGMGGGGASGQPIDGTTIKPKSVQVSGTADQFVCTAATAVCEVESSINAATMTSTVPAFDIGPTATPNTDDRLACFSHGASGSKTRVACIDAEGDVNATSLSLSAASGANAVTLNSGARILLNASEPTRYLTFTGSNQAQFINLVVPADLGFTAGNGTFSTYNQSSASLIGSVNDGANAVATILRSSPTYSTGGAKITSFRNGTSEVAFVDYLGGLTAASCAASAANNQLSCSATGNACELNSSTNASTMTSTVPALELGPTATPDANDRLACFSYGAAGSKTRVACVDAEGDVNATSLTLSAASGANAINLTAGARLLFDATQPTRYLVSNGSTQLDAISLLISASSGFSAGNGQFQTSGQSTATLNGVVNDGATAVATALRSNGTYSTAGAKITSFRNGTSEVAAVDYLGGFNSAVASGQNAFTCSNAGCRLSLGNTARYFYDDGGDLRTPGSFRTDVLVTTPGVSSGGSLEVRGNAAALGVNIRATNGAARVADFMSDTTVVAHIDSDGLPRFNQSNVAKPTCDATNRGKFFFLDGAAGVADIVEVCGKNAADAYAWQALATF